MTSSKSLLQPNKHQKSFHELLFQLRHQLVILEAEIFVMFKVQTSKSSYVKERNY